MLKPTIISLTLCMFISGCSSFGLAQINNNRSGYNHDLDRSEDNQFLLNLVRVHYGFSPYFVGVDSITSQSTLKAGLDNAENRVFQSASSVSGSPFWSVSPGASYTVSPIVTYSPLQGNKFISGLLTPISIEKLFLLEKTLGIGVVLRIAVDEVGMLDNATSTHHLQNSKMPEYQEFNTFTKTLDELINEDEITLEMTNYRDKPAILLYMNTEKAANMISTQLHLNKAYKNIILTRYTLKYGNPEEGNIIHIQTRSYYNMLQFLSNGVNSSPEDNKIYGINSTFISKSGKKADLQEITSRLLNIRVSEDEPSNAALKIPYEKKWYYIENNDNASKATLILLRLVYSLLVGDYQPNLPVITIPTK